MHQYGDNWDSYILFAFGRNLERSSRLFPAILCVLYIQQFFIQTAKGLERVQDMAIAGVISTVSMLLGNVLLLLVFHMGLSGFFVANILSQGLSALFFCVRIKVWLLYNSCALR